MKTTSTHVDVIVYQMRGFVGRNSLAGCATECLIRSIEVAVEYFNASPGSSCLELFPRVSPTNFPYLCHFPQPVVFCRLVRSCAC